MLESDSMDLPWGSDLAGKFVTNVGLITSNGPHGHNIMAAEWAFHVSYSPGLIAISLRPSRTTYANIMKTKEFGVNLAASDQNVVSSVAGGSSGRESDKIKVLEDLGVKFYKGKKTNVMMVKGASLNAECKLVKSLTVGDHKLLIGEVVEASATDKESLVYHGGKYYKVGERIEKPPQDKLEKVGKLIEKYKKNKV